MLLNKESKIVNILMIEDDRELAEIIAGYLKPFDIETTIVESPYIGLSTLKTKKFELLVLDLTLPEIDGLELIPIIRESSDIPIIISSARDDILDKVLGLERGADDYLPKPYNPRELVARIKSILKRRINIPSTKEESSLFEVNKEQMQIYFKNEPLSLTNAEFDILSLLIKRKNAVVSREDLIYSSENIDDDSSLKNIDVIVSRLRQKLAKIDDKKQYIKSIRGVGYQLFQ